MAERLGEYDRATQLYSKALKRTTHQPDLEKCRVLALRAWLEYRKENFVKAELLVPD
jgi:hypothetical protein